MVSSWQLFSEDGTFDRLLEQGTINVIDLSGYGHDPAIRSCAVASLARALYDMRVRARRSEAAGKRDVPLIWMMIDEAHMFTGGGAGRVLINEWLRQGRQPGLSLVLATQRPSALGSDVLSQADVLISHRLTLRDDIEAMEQARPIYVKEPIREAMDRLGTAKGAAIVLDDATESYHIIRMRPRHSAHGGGEPEVYGAD
jgi:DNA helicase HerA-like ATPase